MAGLVGGRVAALEITFVTDGWAPRGPAWLLRKHAVSGRQSWLAPLGTSIPDNLPMWGIVQKVLIDLSEFGPVQ